LVRKYNQVVDRESAYEMLNEKIQEAQENRRPGRKFLKKNRLPAPAGARKKVCSNK
jgi:hypothetical protein